jgi:uncharacterized protein (TIGR02246 family)
MLKRTSLFGFFALAVVLAGCASEVTVDSREADVKAIKDLEAAWVKDAATKDPAKFTTYYANDASVLLPNAPIITGIDAIKAALTPMLADPNFALTFQATKVEASKGGDMVYTVGAYSMTESDEKTKKPVTDKGKYMTVFKKQADGSWKAVVDMLNSDLPAAGGK